MSEESNDVVTGVEESSEASFYYADGVAGDGDAPEWLNTSKYKTVADQAKGYKELQSKFSEMQEKYRRYEGAPESYEAPTLENFELSSDDPMYQTAAEWAKGMEMSQEGFNSLVQLYAETEMARDQAMEAALKAEQEKIPNFDARANDIRDFLSANNMDGLVGLVQNQEQLDQFESLLKMAGKASIDPSGAESANTVTQGDIDKLMNERDENGKVIYRYDRERQKQVKSMFESLYGSGRYIQQVG